MNIISEIFNIFFFSLIGGIIPALIWLWFWLQEDNKHKEPRQTIFLTFLLGMCAAFIALIIQYLFNTYFNWHYIDIENYKIVNLIFVIIEEFAKFVAAYMIFFRTNIFDEPIDAFIYLTTAAIGFAAMENSLFLIKPLLEGQTFDLILHTNIRFIGANILHIASSGILALFIGYSFCKKPLIREIYIWFGLISAIMIHWFFNLTLLVLENSVVFVFLMTWLIVIFMILSLERVKKIKCDI